MEKPGHVSVEINNEMVEAKLRPIRERVHAAMKINLDRWCEEHRAALRRGRV